MKISFLFILSLIGYCDSYNLAIVGASGGLGRELVYQSITNYNNVNVIGFTSKPYKLYEPYRGDGYEETKEMPVFDSRKLKLQHYWKEIYDNNYDSIIFCTSGGPFENDYSDKLMNKFLQNMPATCKDIVLVSCYSVDKNINKYNAAYQIMGNIYLKDVYRAKLEQENIIKKEKNVRKKIYRPPALSYGPTFFLSQTRQELAEEILEGLLFNSTFTS
jgi:hypothetical protein